MKAAWTFVGVMCLLTVVTGYFMYQKTELSGSLVFTIVPSDGIVEKVVSSEVSGIPLPITSKTVRREVR